MELYSGKYWILEMQDGKTTCPTCGAINDHVHGHVAICDHVAKVTVKGKVYYWWAYRPIPWSKFLQ